jgi:hypothetical protein
MKIEHKIYHIFRERITKIVIISALVIYAYIGHILNKPIDWFADRVILLAIAYGFRRALGRIR